MLFGKIERSAFFAQQAVLLTVRISAGQIIPSFAFITNANSSDLIHPYCVLARKS